MHLVCRVTVQRSCCYLLPTYARITWAGAQGWWVIRHLLWSLNSSSEDSTKMCWLNLSFTVWLLEPGHLNWKQWTRSFSWRQFCEELLFVFFNVIGLFKKKIAICCSQVTFWLANSFPSGPARVGRTVTVLLWSDLGWFFLGSTYRWIGPIFAVLLLIRK